ncbi:MAG: hypothetical protein ACYSRR_07880 [Planctomycetota bacterium]|jgi:hypothetical protein
MKDAIKNPLLYFLVVPVGIAIWPLLVWAVYLPNAQNSFAEEQASYEEGEKIIKNILVLDPDRIKLDKREGGKEFEYSSAIREASSKAVMSSMNYSHSTKKKRKGIQTCHVELTEIGIQKFALFLSGILVQWPSLECVKVNFKPVKNKKDVWDIDMDFKYEF